MSDPIEREDTDHGVEPHPADGESATGHDHPRGDDEEPKGEVADNAEEGDAPEQHRHDAEKHGDDAPLTERPGEEDLLERVIGCR